MKIRLQSDLHCEGYKYEYKYAGEDVLVLAGDVHTRSRHKSIIEQIPDTVRVVMVAGNHEYYHGVFEHCNQVLHDLEQSHPNFTFLQNQSVTIDDVQFFGGTMFSDFCLYGEAAKSRIEKVSEYSINDFKVSLRVNGDQRTIWTTADHLEQHVEFCNAIEPWLETTKDQRRVVVTHFVPSPKAIHEKWGSTDLNGYFTSNMERYMGWDGLWLYGHTHDSNDFMVGNTRVVGNPRGYGAENVGGYNPNLILEI